MMGMDYHLVYVMWLTTPLLHVIVSPTFAAGQAACTKREGSMNQLINQLQPIAKSSRHSGNGYVLVINPRHSWRGFVFASWFRFFSSFFFGRKLPFPAHELKTG